MPDLQKKHSTWEFSKRICVIFVIFSFIVYCTFLYNVYLKKTMCNYIWCMYIWSKMYKNIVDWWSTIPPISTKQTMITSQSNQYIKKIIIVGSCLGDSHKNVLCFINTNFEQISVRTQHAYSILISYIKHYLYNTITFFKVCVEYAWKPNIFLKHFVSGSFVFVQ